MKRILFSILLVAAVAGCGDVEWFPNDQEDTSSLSISSTSLPVGSAGTPYSQTLVATGGTTPYTWAVTKGSVPAGMVLSTAGVLSGTPTTAGTSAITVQVTDSAAPPLTATLDLTIQIRLPETLSAGQSATLRSNDSIKVPSGTTITADATVITVTGNNRTVITAPGSIVAVPSDATGAADNTIIASL